MFSISGIVHFKSKALERTILKIYALSGSAPQGMLRPIYLLNVNAMTCAAEDQASFHGPCKSFCLIQVRSI
jgi:hypothetical protein